MGSHTKSDGSLGWHTAVESWEKIRLGSDGSTPIQPALQLVGTQLLAVFRTCCHESCLAAIQERAQISPSLSVHAHLRVLITHNTRATLLGPKNEAGRTLYSVSHVISMRRMVYMSLK